MKPASAAASNPSASDPLEGEVIDAVPIEPNDTGDFNTFELRMERHSGPLPHPTILAGYESVHPGLADRIVRMAEKQQDHRIDVEKKVVTSNTKRSEQGLYAGVIVSIGCLVTAAYFAHLGHPAWGAGLFGATVVSLVTVFVTGKLQQKDDLSTKAKVVPEIEVSKKPKKAVTPGDSDKTIDSKARDSQNDTDDSPREWD